MARWTLDPQVLVALVAGFVAFSFPLLLHDLGLWTPKFAFLDAFAAPEGFAADATQDNIPGNPGYPDFHGYNKDYRESYQDEPELATKFRNAVNEGDIPEAERLRQAGLAEEPPLEVVDRAHWHGNTPLYEAARSGNKAMCEWLLSKGADADHANEWGDAAINEAASMGHWDVVWLLADHGASLARQSEHGHNSMALSAVRHRSIPALEQIKRRGGKLDAGTWNGNTVLHEAARMGERAIVSWLVGEGGLNVNQPNEAGEGPIVEAAESGHVEVVTQLIEAGATFGAPGSIPAKSLMFAAIRHANLDLLKLMREKGHNVDDPHHEEPGAEPNAADHHRDKEPLIEAVKAADGMAVVEWLIQQGANVTAVNLQDEPVIAIAAYEDMFEMVWRLNEAGASLKSLNEHGGSILMSAVHHGRTAEVRRLLGAGLDVNHANTRGDTALSIAAQKGDVEIMRALTDHGATAAPRGPRGDTPLIRAARFRKVDALHFLLEPHGMHAGTHAAAAPQIDLRNSQGDTALITAARQAGTGVVQLLLQHNAQVNLANKAGMTAFLCAAEAGSLELLKMLHTAGADAHAVTKHHEGALELSRWGRHADEIKAALKGWGVDEREGHAGARSEQSHEFP